ncbi:hypothetical protein AAFF_G00328130 [Aldrovandia affinis]|uniref:U1-type domain-containing protein n=1 Tax=Aldrovandia affinis TaxID=143900 RepID=A0AAD7T9N6_9TELE|nr:hypothetical protein AAFF_G00328130 [Aldrovandia affinis]
MKGPLSLTHLLENGRLCLPNSPCGGLKESINSHADPRLQREKKRLLFSLCEVCNIQLNSAAQAQVHYNGKSHLKRVKQLNNGELPVTGGSKAPLDSNGSGRPRSQASPRQSFIYPSTGRCPAMLTSNPTLCQAETLHLSFHLPACTYLG